MNDKKAVRISVRIPQSWIKVLRERNVPISVTCRSALYQSINQSDPVLQSMGKLRSKQQAARLWQALSVIRVHTLTEGMNRILKESSLKLPVFREFLINKCNPEELMILAEFMQQGEHAEQVLQDVFV